MPSTGSFSFTTPVGMVDRVHRDTSVHWTPSQPTSASRFADRDVLVIDIADLADRRHAVLRDLAGLPGRQFHERVLFFLRNKLRRSTGRTHHLPALAWLEFQVVDDSAWRNIPQRQRVAHKN